MSVVTQGSVFIHSDGLVVLFTYAQVRGLASHPSPAPCAICAYAQVRALASHPSPVYVYVYVCAYMHSSHRHTSLSESSRTRVPSASVTLALFGRQGSRHRHHRRRSYEAHCCWHCRMYSSGQGNTHSAASTPQSACPRCSSSLLVIAARHRWTVRASACQCVCPSACLHVRLPARLLACASALARMQP